MSMVVADTAAGRAVAGCREAAVGTGGAWPVARLHLRLLRRGALWLTLAATFYVGTELVTFLVTYPDQASRARLADLSDNPGVRVLEGIPHGIATIGGFIAWDAGWVLEALVGTWVVITTTRFLRGEEEARRAECVLAAPLDPVVVAAVQLAVAVAAAATVSAAVSVLLLVCATGAAGSVLLGACLALSAATYATAAAVVCQLFASRRAAVGVSAAIVGAAFLLRMLANASSANGWLRWFTPFGWLDDLQPYAGPRWLVLVPAVLTPVAFSGLALWLRSRRDFGAGLRTDGGPVRPRLRLLGTPAGFAWRANRGVLIGWILGLGTYGIVMGSLLPTITDFLLKDPSYRKVLKTMGVDTSAPTRGFVAYFGVTLGLFFALYACWRAGSASGEETSERLATVLARPVSRLRWGVGQLAAGGVGLLVLTTTTGAALWAGGVAAGAQLGLADALRTTANTVPMTALFGAVACLVYALAPRATVPASVTFAVAAYLVQVVGTAMGWPSWLMDLSPFHHLAAVPLHDFAPVAAAVMTALAAVCAAAALAVFGRRDVAG